jgi:hypothetical protein
VTNGIHEVETKRFNRSGTEGFFARVSGVVIGDGSNSDIRGELNAAIDAICYNPKMIVSLTEERGEMRAACGCGKASEPDFDYRSLNPVTLGFNRHAVQRTYIL